MYTKGTKHDQEGFIPSMEVKVSIEKSTDVAHHISRLKMQNPTFIIIKPNSNASNKQES
jgi:hypothetical protein